MGGYVAFLRGINVSGHNLIKMADLKSALGDLNFKSLSTYLQSGNLVFKSEIKDVVLLESMIAENIGRNFSMDIRVKVIPKDVYIKVFRNNPFVGSGNIETKYLYYIHLMGFPDKEKFNAIKRDETTQEQMELDGEVIYLHYPNGYGRSRLNNNYFERKLNVSATARNFNTMKKLYGLLMAIS